jgi:uncharacterized membrane protein
MTRPLGLTVLALLLAWLSLGGFVIALWASTIDVRWSFRAPALIVGAVYGLSALAAAVALWRLRQWAHIPLKVWTLATVLAAWLPRLTAQNDASIWITVLGSLVVGVVALLIHRYAIGQLAQRAA